MVESIEDVNHPTFNVGLVKAQVDYPEHKLCYVDKKNIGTSWRKA